MDKIVDYCFENIDFLVSYEQGAFQWRKLYDVDELRKIEQFNRVESLIPDLINRDHILGLIKLGKFYQAYVEIMLWGQVGSKPGSNKSKKTEIAQKIFNHDSQKIDSLFQITMTGNLSQIEELYNSLERQGSLKIPEVDVSYFTKLLSFASEASNQNFKLLIYDKWTKLIHVHLLFDLDEQEEVQSFFSNHSLINLYSKSEKNKIPATKLIYPRAGKSFKVYWDYCQRMSDLASLISKEKNKTISAFQLESFLFGHDLKGKKKKVISNPRYWIQQNFANQYLGKISAEN